MTSLTTTRRPSAADRKNAAQAADQAKAKLGELLAAQTEIVPSSASGRSATGDNGKGHAKAATKPTQKATTKPSAGKPTPKATAPATAVVAAQPQDEARYRGTVAKGEDTVTCIGTCANGHITDDAAQVCARKLEREHGDGWAIVPSVRVDRYRGIVTPKASGAKPTVCECKFSHKTQDAAIECAGRLAKAHGLTV